MVWSGCKRQDYMNGGRFFILTKREGDAKNVSIGARTNVQDRAVVNAATTIGEDVTVGI